MIAFASFNCGTLAAGETVSADVNFMSADSPGFSDATDVLLMSNNSLVATLFSAQAGILLSVLFVLFGRSRSLQNRAGRGQFSICPY